jgi:probable phosphoglycerate mutase
MIVVVRHGQTAWSESGRHTGRTDLPLIEAGRRRARALRADLGDQAFSLVLCSPLLAARWLQLHPSAGARFAFAPGAVSWLGYERETEVLARWNWFRDA